MLFNILRHIKRTINLKRNISLALTYPHQIGIIRKILYILYQFRLRRIHHISNYFFLKRENGYSILCLAFSGTGFFSQCSYRLKTIIISSYYKCEIDERTIFNSYRPKSRNNINMIEIYFQRENIEKYLPGTKRKIASLYQGSFERKILGLHTTIYKAIEFNITTPLVKRYFSPSERIKKTIRQIEQKYKLNYDVLCAIYYRGTDKVKETNLPSYEEVLQKASDIKKTHPHIHFLLQSDEDGFLKKIQKNFSNCIVFEDENIPRVHIKNRSSKDEITAACDSNFKHSILSVIHCNHYVEV